mmetsp:Transcript_34610/g.33822  ORF Transcript_34610/g.33822 Transcript_34610/m.33822 type:complete len:83 (+) Transcript_34610:2143-2391(+)
MESPLMKIAGQYVSGVADKNFRIDYQHGSFYVGEILNGVRHGQGVFTGRAKLNFTAHFLKMVLEGHWSYDSLMEGKKTIYAN